MAHKTVIVGYDTSPEGREAVAWAARVSERRGASLTVLAATGWRTPPPELSGLITSGESLAQRAAEEGADLARQVVPGLDVVAIGAQNTAVAVLQEFSHAAELVVVGHRGAGAQRLGQIGSVAFAIANTAQSPVAIVRGTAGPFPSAERPSVVAVDGSSYSFRALDTAAAWAQESGSALRIVTAWRAQLARPWSLGGGGGASESAHGAKSRAQRRAEELAQEAAARVETRYPDLKLDTTVGEGRPSEVIIAAAETAGIIVIGARGRGDLASLLLGSVSREVVEHAHCPVYVVR